MAEDMGTAVSGVVDRARGMLGQSRLSTPTAQTTTQTATPGTDADLKGLLDGNVVPMLETLLQHAYEGYMAPPPNRNDYGNEDDYLNDLFSYQEGAGDRLDAVTKIATQLNQARKLGTGTIELNDGTLITQEMLKSNDPAVAAQARAAFENRSREVLNGYNSLMNETGLAQYSVNLEATNAENDRRAKTFESQMNTFDAGMDWDKANIGRTADVINRELSGMQESRARADLATKALLDAAPWATTPGKTDYTANEFGSGIAGMVRLAGGDPSQPLIKFPSTVTIDPQALMAQGDAALGVGQGPLPGVPELTTPRDAVPLAPTYLGGPSAPTFSQPVAPVSAADQMRAQQQLVDIARLMGGRLGRMV